MDVEFPSRSLPHCYQEGSDARYKEEELLTKANPKLDSRVGFLTSNACLKIEEGSFFLTMPTMDGRSAVVFFPPRDESLEDIKYMLGTDDLGEVDVRQMKRARLVDCGKGCILRSTSV